MFLGDGEDDRGTAHTDQGTKCEHGDSGKILFFMLEMHM